MPVSKRRTKPSSIGDDGFPRAERVKQTPRAARGQDRVWHGRPQDANLSPLEYGDLVYWNSLPTGTLVMYETSPGVEQLCMVNRANHFHSHLYGLKDKDGGARINFMDFFLVPLCQD